MLVLAALDGPEALNGYLDSHAEPSRPEPLPEAEKNREPLGAYLKAITVEGFRGIGQKTTLDLPPGPGLTLVVGRNGSGKSSFAEGLELLVTGESYRWAKRAKVWQQGWRNLHHKPAAIDAEFLVEGEKGSTVLATRWTDEADLAAAETYAQIHGKPRMEPEELGWKEALATYRPFLSYNELGSMLDEGPSKLFDALSAILGLGELNEAQELLAEARKAREKAHKDAGQSRDQIVGLLRPMDDERARTLVTAMERKDWGVSEAEAVLAQSVTGSAGESDIRALQQIASLAAPSQEVVTTIARELREAHERVKATAGTLAGRSKDLAEVLDQALRFHTAHGDGDCPVCGQKAALSGPWHEHQAKEVKSLRDAAKEATGAHDAATAARRKALALPSPTAESLTQATGLGLDAAAATQALDQWRAGLATTAELDALANHIEATAGPLEKATAALRTAAMAELQRREDRWKPVAPLLAAWIEPAKQAQKGHEAVKPLKAAEAWLKQAASDIRNDRFAPIKGKAQQIWNQLRLQSNVSLEDIRLSGTATKRQVDLDVTVDGLKAAALGVMSQGEQNALALSLFIPRATLPESPFRFLVIDDPVQSMDPSRIDGLARVLHETAGKRQVVVFTHDDRLPEAVRRLAIPATVIEVTRREGSARRPPPSQGPGLAVHRGCDHGRQDRRPATPSRPPRHPRPLPPGRRRRLHRKRPPPPSRPRRAPRSSRGSPDQPHRQQVPSRPGPLRRREAHRRRPPEPAQARQRSRRHLPRHQRRHPRRALHPDARPGEEHGKASRLDAEAPMTPTETLALAQQLLDRPDAKTASLWPRAAALLARQALEHGLDDYWRSRGIPLQAIGTTPQLVCLAEYLPDTDLAGRTRHTWHALSQACHHHPYELAPGRDELSAWMATVGELLAALDHATDGGLAPHAASAN